MMKLRFSLWIHFLSLLFWGSWNSLGSIYGTESLLNCTVGFYWAITSVVHVSCGSSALRLKMDTAIFLAYSPGWKIGRMLIVSPTLPAVWRGWLSFPPFNTSAVLEAPTDTLLYPSCPEAGQESAAAAEGGAVYRNFPSMPTVSVQVTS